MNLYFVRNYCTGILYYLSYSINKAYFKIFVVLISTEKGKVDLEKCQGNPYSILY